MNDPAYDAVSLQLTKALHKSTLGNSTDGALNFREPLCPCAQQMKDDGHFPPSSQNVDNSLAGWREHLRSRCSLVASEPAPLSRTVAFGATEVADKMALVAKAASKTDLHQVQFAFE